MRLAAIDVGTNSVRLYVADSRDGALVPVERDLVITRLGEGVDRTGRLGEEPLRRTVEAIRTYRERAAGAERVRIAATSAVRDAANRDEFFSAVRAATGQDAEVLTGEEEARASFLGATSDLPAGGGRYLVLDIGGGSTEFVAGDAPNTSQPNVSAWISIDIGSVRLTERHIAHELPTGQEIAAVAADADAAVAKAIEAVGTGAGVLLGLAGTITTLAAIDLGLEGYDRDAIHHARLRLDRIVEMREMLAAMPVTRRRKLPAMPPGREDVIVAGAVLLERVTRGFGFAEVVVSETDILDGLVLSLIGNG
jgi:exopolyphosphatase/guanosine-5'-triphosphate,3'-diphosphate pyrophosphatase